MGRSRRWFLRAGALGAVGTLLGPGINLGRCRVFAAGPEEAPIEVSTRAVDLVLGSTVIDMLGLLTLDWARLRRWQTWPDEFELADYRQLETSGVRVFHPAVETGSGDHHETARRWLAGWNHLLDGRVCFLERIDSIDALSRAASTGEIGVVLGFQNSEHFRTAEDVALFYELGQRVSQLTYNEHNRLGSGCYQRSDRGLTDFGAAIVQEMNRVGMAIDLSHCGERTTREAIALSRVPVLVTHANCAALNVGHPRCKSDETLRLLAAKGGVVGITVVKAFVGGAAPGLADVLDHFDHAAKVAGVEHVGLGSDVDVTATDPQTGEVRPFYAIRGLDPTARVFQIADGLLRRGWTRADVGLVLGGNFARALGSIWSREGGAVESVSGPGRDPFCPAPNPELPPGLRVVHSEDLP